MKKRHNVAQTSHQTVDHILVSHFTSMYNYIYFRNPCTVQYVIIPTVVHLSILCSVYSYSILLLISIFFVDQQLVPSLHRQLVDA